LISAATLFLRVGIRKSVSLLLFQIGSDFGESGEGGLEVFCKFQISACQVLISLSTSQLLTFSTSSWSRFNASTIQRFTFTEG